jgi:hypothetical protein
MKFTDADIDELDGRLRAKFKAESAEAHEKSLRDVERRRAVAEEAELREAPRRRRRDVTMATTLAGFCALQAADALTTYRGLKLPGRVEGNPLAVPMLTLGAAGYVVKMGVAANLSQDIWKRREQRTARWFAYGLTAVSLYAVANNLRQIRRG